MHAGPRLRLPASPRLSLRPSLIAAGLFTTDLPKQHKNRSATLHLGLAYCENNGADDRCKSGFLLPRFELLQRCLDNDDTDRGYNVVLQEIDNDVNERRNTVVLRSAKLGD